jgi:nucleolar protein 14
MLGGGIPATDSSLQTGISSKRGKKPIVVEEEEAEDEEEIDEMADMNDDDEDDEDDDDEEGDDDDEEGGVKDLTDKELEEALSTKSGVDRDLLRRLIGKLSSKDDGSDSDDDAEAEMLADAARAAKSAEPKIIPSLPSQAASYSVSSKTDHDRPAFPSIFPTFTPTASADPYDSYVRLLALEPRAQASDRLKTSLELAREEVERLGIMEKKRLRRERGEDSESDDEETKKAKLKKKRAPQGDDLDDDYAMDGSDEEGADEQLGQGLVGGFGNQIIELQEPVVVEEKSEEEEEDEEDEDDDDNAMDLEDLEGSDEEVGGEVEALVSGERLPTTNIFDKKARTWTGQSAPSIDSLPFTFPCPSTHADFLRLLATAGIVPGKGNEEESKDGTITVIKRIRTLYHPGLGDGNKEKLQVCSLSTFCAKSEQ